ALHSMCADGRERRRVLTVSTCSEAKRHYLLARPPSHGSRSTRKNPPPATSVAGGPVVPATYPGRVSQDRGDRQGGERPGSAARPPPAAEPRAGQPGRPARGRRA